MYTHPSGLSIVPASLQLKDLVNVDITSMKKTLKHVFYDYDMVLLDSAPGFGREAMLPLRISDEVIFVANPSIPSVVDIAKYSQLPESPEAIGIILNRTKGKKYELTAEEITQFTEMPVIGIIPEDENVLKSSNSRELAITVKQNSKASRAFFEVAATLSGVEYKVTIMDRLAGFFSRKKDYNRLTPSK